jgi:hypothetical protein
MNGLILDRRAASALKGQQQLPWSIPRASDCRPTVIAIPSRPEAVGRGGSSPPVARILGPAALPRKPDN